jgi:hypothetical protein
MVITITSIKLQSAWYFFKLSWHGLHISLQCKKTPGFLHIKNTGFGYDHFTMSAWKNEADMKAFARSGAHLTAMKQSAQLANEIRTYTFEGDKLPTWREAKELLKANGKLLRY